MVASTSILERVLAPADGSLSPEVAAFMLSLNFPKEVHDRYALLADKAKAGDLSDGEQQELDDYLNTDVVISLLKSKARRSSAQQSIRRE